MTAARLAVTLVGVAAIGCVLWYFLAVPSPPGASRKGAQR